LQTAAGAEDPGGGQRLPRDLRLLRPVEFGRVFKGNPCRLGGPALTLLALANDLGHPRLGMAISRKHVRTSVGRNRLKRQLRESFRMHQYQVGAFDIVVLARPGLDRIAPRDVRVAVDRLWAGLAERCAAS
jgi:ribonuclease P protein component